MDIQYSVELEVAKDKTSEAIAKLRKARNKHEENSKLYLELDEKVISLMLSMRNLRELSLADLTNYTNTIVEKTEESIKQTLATQPQTI